MVIDRQNFAGRLSLFYSGRFFIFDKKISSCLDILFNNITKGIGFSRDDKVGVKDNGIYDCNADQNTPWNQPTGLDE